MIPGDVQKTKAEIEKLARQYGLTLVVLFGSQVTGNTHPESDFDAAYLSDKRMSFDEEAQINAALTEIFKSNEVQLVNIKNASPLLLRRMVQSAIVLYEKRAHLFDEVYVYALRVYEEAEPLFALQKEYVARKIKSYQHAG